MKQILLIDREFGAGGSAIADQLARRLNWQLLDQALSEEIARHAKLPVNVCREREERTDPWLQRLINILCRGSLGPNQTSPEHGLLDTDRLVSVIQRVIEQAVESKPCVIVGRGAPYFLRKRDDTFCVFLYASREHRFRRILKRLGDEKEAGELVDSMDEDRRKFVKHYFGHDWPDRHLFHAMLNTGMGDENIVEAILHMLRATAPKEGAAKA